MNRNISNKYTVTVRNKFDDCYGNQPAVGNELFRDY